MPWLQWRGGGGVGIDEELYLFLNPAWKAGGGVRGQRHAPAALPLGKSPGTHSYPRGAGSSLIFTVQCFP
jgi:hypothetical protein